MFKISMKWPVALALLAACGAGAQTIDLIIVEKVVHYEQTSASHIQLDSMPLSPTNGGPFEFDIGVHGQGLGGITPPTITGPFGSVDPVFHHGGVMGRDPNEDAWRYGWPIIDDIGGTSISQAEMDSDFGSGVYTVTVLGVDVPLNLTGDAYPNTPSVTLTGGQWSHGVYVISADQTLGVTTNAFTDYGSHVEDIFISDLFGSDVDQEIFRLASEEPGANALSQTLPASVFSVGELYTLETAFIAVVDTSPQAAFPESFINAAAYQVNTQVRIRLPMPGDVSNDGVIDQNDVGAFANHFEPGVGGKTLAQGDLNADGVADIADFGILAFNFGNAVGSVSASTQATAAVPEPGAIALWGLGVLTLMRRRRTTTSDEWR